MKNDVQIVDRGRGPQLSSSRITVLDVFYYVHRGYDFDAVREAMPSLTREEWQTILAYVQDHRDELMEKDRQAEEFHRRGIEEQRAREGGIFAETVEDLTTEQRAARLQEKIQKKTSGAKRCPSYCLMRTLRGTGHASGCARVYHSPLFLERVVEKLLDYIFYADNIRGAGRLCLP